MADSYVLKVGDRYWNGYVIGRAPVLMPERCFAYRFRSREAARASLQNIESKQGPARIVRLVPKGGRRG